MGVSWLMGGEIRGRTMPKYRFSSLTADGALLSSRVEEAASDDEAREVAGELLADEKSEAVEVWSAWRLVHRAVEDPSHSAPLINSAGTLGGSTRPHHRRQ